MKLLLYICVGLFNFAALAIGGIFQPVAIVLFVVILISMCCKPKNPRKG